MKYVVDLGETVYFLFTKSLRIASILEVMECTMQYIDDYVRNAMYDLGIFEFEEYYPAFNGTYIGIEKHFRKVIPFLIDPIIASIHSELQKDNKLPIHVNYIDSNIDTGDVTVYSKNISRMKEYDNNVEFAINQSMLDMVDSFLSNMSTTSTEIIVTLHFKYCNHNFLRYYCRLHQ